MSYGNITEVRLLNVPLENDYIHSIYFNTLSEQTSYFANKVVRTGTGFSYQRKEKKIRFPAQYDDLIGCNYVMYKNSGYSNKWFYAFITDMEYIDDGRTDISIETDVIQTWLFDYHVKPSFIEREHVDDDTVGLHTVPENVELGQFVCNALSTDNQLKTCVYVLQCTEDTQGGKLYATNYGGIWQSGGAYICEDGRSVHDIVQVFANNGKADAVFSVYMIPKKILKNTNTEDMKYSGSGSPAKYVHSVSKLKQIDGYTPKNNKLLTYPYNYLILSNNSGSSNILKFERFVSENEPDTCEFEIQGVATIGGSIKCVPINYNGIEHNQNEGIMLGKFPTCSWSEDLYTNWLTQNAVNIGLGIASGGLQVIGGVALMSTGGGALAGAGTVASGGLSIAQTLGQVYQMSFTPDSAQGNINGGDINTCNNMNTFHFYSMSIKKEYAQIIDNYFNMFGYKVNRVKIPSIFHRENYWYTKTIDVNIDGAVPTNDLNKIKECYNKGITFWSNPANIGNYNVSNEIIG